MKPIHDTDASWEWFGRNDPYYGVLTERRYHKAILDDQAKAEFFASGFRYVERLLERLLSYQGCRVPLASILDVGCGVGRLTIPLARHARRTYGLDVSESMLNEAGKNAQEHGMREVCFLLSDDALSSVRGMQFSLVHSYQVFQHIMPHRGMAILRQCLTRLADGGIGVLHFSISCVDPLLSRRAPLLKRVGLRIRCHSRTVHRFLNTLRGMDPDEPLPIMRMYTYQLNEIIKIVYACACGDIRLDLTDHGGSLGVIVYVRKSPPELVAP